MIKVTILDNGRIITAKKGSNLLKVLKKNDIKISSPCGGKGTCKKCKASLQVFQNGIESYEDILTCKYKLDKDICIRIKDATKFVDKKSSLVKNQVYKVQKQIKKVPFEFDKATLKHDASIVDRLEKAVGQSLKISIDLLHKLCSDIGTGAYKGYAIIEGDRLLTITTEDIPLLGAAIDIGTTTMVLYLVNLENGKVEGISSASNPQAVHGADVISRIAYCTESVEKRKELKDAVQAGVKELTDRVLKMTGLNAEYIFKATVCGNTTMMHLFLGLEPRHIALAPYLATYRTIQPVKASSVGMKWNGEAILHIIPNIAGFVGADTVSVIQANKLDKTKKTIMALDLGTNGELALAVGGKILTCATAAGPALEGASIEYGMRADVGAIESLDIIDNEIVLKTIDDGTPVGICGSGLIDGAAKLLNHGLILKNGRVAALPDENPLSRWLGTFNGQRAIKLYENLEEPDKEIWLTQKDIRELQLAKGALLAGMNVLMKRAGITNKDIKAIYLAGAFGSYVNTKSALEISMFPDIALERIVAVGNSAGQGAIINLLSADERKRAEKISVKSKYIELSTDKDFNSEFARCMSF
ncbi:DUF4445 domain-containing protein [Clostridia bacterium]|nr:DUF4445 domain-containing protein [Clostridia bacterium]